MLTSQRPKSQLLSKQSQLKFRHLKNPRLNR
jgi:hypothetical protein